MSKIYFWLFIFIVFSWFSQFWKAIEGKSSWLQYPQELLVSFCFKSIFGFSFFFVFFVCSILFHYFYLNCHYFCVFLTPWHYHLLCFQSPLWSLLIRLPVCKVVSFCVCSSRLKKYGIQYSFLEVVLCKTPFELREHLWNDENIDSTECNIPWMKSLL